MGSDNCALVVEENKDGSKNDLVIDAEPLVLGNEGVHFSQVHTGKGSLQHIFALHGCLDQKLSKYGCSNKHLSLHLHKYLLQINTPTKLFAMQYCPIKFRNTFLGRKIRL